MIERRSLLMSLAALGASAILLPTPVWAETTLNVVASFSILGDMVKQVGGDRVAVTTLVGPDGDAHVFQPTPKDARAVAGTDLLIVNGLAFEGWMDRLVEASGYTGKVVVATTGVTPRVMAGGHHDHAEGHEHEHEHVHEHEHEHVVHAEGHHHHHHHGGVDPHAWQSLTNAKIYVGNIANGLIEADPAGAAVYRANAERYVGEIEAAEIEIEQVIAALPPERRNVVTTHAAFGYFADAYGIAFHTPVGTSTEAEPSAGDVAALIRQIKQDDIRAVFLENISDPRLLDQIARETGVRIGGVLYSDALSASDPEAFTYLGMMRHNVRALAASLGV